MSSLNRTANHIVHNDVSALLSVFAHLVNITIRGQVSDLIREIIGNINKVKTDFTSLEKVTMSINTDHVSTLTETFENTRCVILCFYVAFLTYITIIY